MAPITSPQHADRARRFSLRLRVLFRKPDSAEWSEGTTENISYTGMLFLSSSLLAPETTLELRVPIRTGTKGKHSTEIRCKGAVVRVEQRGPLENHVALAVTFRDYRIIGRHMLGGIRAGNA